MSRIIYLSNYKQPNQHSEPHVLDLLACAQENEHTIELVVNDYGTIRVIHITRKPHDKHWILHVRTLEEMIDDVLNENPTTAS